MNELIAALGRLFGKFTILLAIAPWEQGLRVRGGKTVAVLKAGLHWRIPFLDVIHVQSVRKRAAQVSTQTVMTADGYPVVVGSSVSYAVANIALLYERMHHAEDTITNIVAVHVAGCVSRTMRAGLSISEVSAKATDDVTPLLERAGLSDVEVQITDFSVMKAIRLVQDLRGSHSNNDILQTSKVG